MKLALVLLLAACGDNRPYTTLEPIATDRHTSVQTTTPSTPTHPTDPLKPPTRHQLAIELKPAWRFSGVGTFTDGVVQHLPSMATCEEWVAGASSPAYPWELSTRIEAIIELPAEALHPDLTVAPIASYTALLGPVQDFAGPNNVHCKEFSHSVTEWRANVPGSTWAPVPREYTGSTYDTLGATSIRLRVRLHGLTSTILSPTTLIARWTD
jgi:hypothetical protein